MTATRFPTAGKFHDDEQCTKFAIPVSYRQLMAAGVSLNSSFDDDAGEGDAAGELLLVMEQGEGDNLEFYDRSFYVLCLQCTLARRDPHWAIVDNWFHGVGSRRSLFALADMWDILVTSDMATMINADAKKRISVLAQLRAENQDDDDLDDDDVN